MTNEKYIQSMLREKMGKIFQEKTLLIGIKFSVNTMDGLLLAGQKNLEEQNLLQLKNIFSNKNVQKQNVNMLCLLV